MGYFRFAKSIYGPYVQVRVRDKSGSEDTVDRLYTHEDIIRVWDSLAQTMKPLTTREEALRLL